MNKIRKAFEKKKAFIGFLTAGDPSLEKTEEYIIEMAKAGAALIEIGIPFSDPLAEGAVIQDANVRALSAPGGCTTDMIFEMVSRVSKKVNIPLVFLSYLNPVFTYGYEKFFQKCTQVGIREIIIPDLPYEEKEELVSISSKYGVDYISLIAPTSENRIQKIAKEATGYIYVVSSLGVTGMRKEITTDIGKMVENIRKVTDVPIAIGFGINTPKQAATYSAIADGVIVGSAIVKKIGEHGEHAGKHISEYVKTMVAGMENKKEGVENFSNNLDVRKVK